jgi:4-aminobutyrate aminotransferase-like enzyme
MAVAKPDYLGSSQQTKLTRHSSFEEELNFAIGVRQLCKKYNILFIADEVRMGSGKSGKFLCSDWMGPENKPDMVVMGKSITGGYCCHSCDAKDHRRGEARRPRHLDRAGLEEGNS